MIIPASTRFRGPLARFAHIYDGALTRKVIDGAIKPTKRKVNLLDIAGRVQRLPGQTEISPEKAIENIKYRKIYNGGFTVRKKSFLKEKINLKIISAINKRILDRLTSSKDFDTIQERKGQILDSVYSNLKGKFLDIKSLKSPGKGLSEASIISESNLRRVSEYKFLQFTGKKMDILT